MDVGKGTFRGDLIAAGLKASVAGSVSGSRVKFRGTPTAAGSASDWTADLSGNGFGLKVTGSLSTADGRSGSFSGSRVSAAVPLDALPAGDGGKSTRGRPPLPANGRELSPGQLPRQCTGNDGALQGYYFSAVAKQWVAAPFCFGRWGFLEATGSQIVAAGKPATVTAIPTDGSNSGTYAPQTGSIQWQFAGKAVSGCGTHDLSCTVISTTAATSEWQWFEIHVSMPRTFFIDSPGDLCGGQHLCSGASTNAWSYVGIAPSAAAVTVSGGSGPSGGGGSGEGGGPPLPLVLGAAALAAAALGAAAIGSRDRFVTHPEPSAPSPPVPAPPNANLTAIMGMSALVGPYLDSLANTTPADAAAKWARMPPHDETQLGHQLDRLPEVTHPQPPAPPPPVPPTTSANMTAIMGMSALVGPYLDSLANTDAAAKWARMPPHDETQLGNQLGRLTEVSHPEAPPP